MRKNKLLGLALIGAGIGIGIYLIKKNNRKYNNDCIDKDFYDDEDYFDDDFYCDVEDIDVVENKCNLNNNEKKDLETKIVEEESNIVDITNCKNYLENEFDEKNKEQNDILTNQLNKEVREKIIKQKEDIVSQREELFKNKREGLIVGKDFKEKKKELGQREEELNRILAEMKK